MEITHEQELLLKEPLPNWAIKKHPLRANMTVIHPMAVVDRLNEVFGVGQWNFKVEYINCIEGIQKTQTGERTIYKSEVKGTLEIDDLILEQFGGSTNDDRGDALKGGATDALTKIASYLGIGASIYKGQGNGEEQEEIKTRR